MTTPLLTHTCIHTHTHTHAKVCVIEDMKDKGTSYSVKVVNPLGRGGYELLTLESQEVYASITREAILACCEGYIEADKDIQFGYVVPGHGKKGKQIAILSDADIREMYTPYDKKNILLWMKQCRKRPRVEPSSSSSNRPTSRSNYDYQTQRMAEIDSICDQLVEKHGQKYTKEQIRAWAIMIQMGKLDSHERPPDKHVFKSGKKKGDFTATAVGVSPGKRLNMRSECIDQLDKWHRLMERGATTSEQYQEIQDNILSDIKKV